MLTCQKCRALLAPRTKTCPYCGTDQRHQHAPSDTEDELRTTRFGLWILGLNLALFALMVVLDPAKAERREALTPTTDAYLMFGWAQLGMVRHCGQYWRLLSSMFLHADVLHLMLNAVGLFYLVPIAARTFGASRTIFIYFASGLCGAALSHLFGNSGLGASGSLCGLIAASAVYGWRRGGIWKQALTRGMVMWALLIVLWGFFVMPGRVDNAGHLGGFAGGAALGWLGAAVRARGGLADRLWTLLARTAVGLAVALAVVFWAPNLLRGFERRDVELYQKHADRTLDQLEAHLGGDRDVRIAEGFEEGPGNSGPVTEAVRRALEAVRRGDPDAAARVGAARAAFERWQDAILCSHALRPLG